MCYYISTLKIQTWNEKLTKHLKEWKLTYLKLNSNTMKVHRTSLFLHLLTTYYEIIIKGLLYCNRLFITWRYECRYLPWMGWWTKRMTNIANLLRATSQGRLHQSSDKTVSSGNLNSAQTATSFYKLKNPLDNTYFYSFKGI